MLRAKCDISNTTAWQNKNKKKKHITPPPPIPRPPNSSSVIKTFSNKYRFCIKRFGSLSGVVFLVRNKTFRDYLSFPSSGSRGEQGHLKTWRWDGQILPKRLVSYQKTTPGKKPKIFYTTLDRGGSLQTHKYRNFILTSQCILFNNSLSTNQLNALFSLSLFIYKFPLHMFRSS
jgi:hypothetical protein